MIGSSNLKTITDLRKFTLNILNTVTTNRSHIYILSRSKPLAVIISMEEYGKLLKYKREAKLYKKKLIAQKAY